MAGKLKVSESKNGIGRFAAVFALAIAISFLIFFFRVPLRYESARIEKVALGTGHSNWIKEGTILSKKSDCKSCHAKSLLLNRSLGFGK
jgi:hypothetical protein